MLVGANANATLTIVGTEALLHLGQSSLVEAVVGVAATQMSLGTSILQHCAAQTLLLVPPYWVSAPLCKVPAHCDRHYPSLVTTLGLITPVQDSIPHPRTNTPICFKYTPQRFLGSLVVFATLLPNRS